MEALMLDPATLETVLERAGVGELPTLPVVAAKLLNLTRSERTAVGDLVKVVETDPVISAKVLRIVNSAAYALPQRIGSLHQAVMLLGFSAMQALALEVVIFEGLVKGGRRSRFDRVFFWQHCLAVASLAGGLAEACGHPHPEEVYVAGLLHDLGKLILDARGRIRYREVVDGRGQSEIPMVEEERQLVGLGHDDLGGHFCAQWGLPERVGLAVKWHHRRFAGLRLAAHDALLVAAVSLANYLAWIQGVGSVRLRRHPILQPEVEEIIDLERLDLRALLARMDRDVQGVAAFYGLQFPAPEQFREHLLWANIRLGRVSSRYYFLKEDAREQLSACLRLRQSLTRPHHSLEAGEIVASTLEAVRQDFGFDRVCLLRVDPDSRSLVVVDARDSRGQAGGLVGIGIGLPADAGGFLECLRRKEPAIISGRTGHEATVLAQMRVAALGLVPFGIGTPSAAVIGVDHAVSRRPLDMEALRSLAIVAHELGVALENARRFEELKTRANLDGLTGVANRAALGEALAVACRGGRDLRPFSIAMLDVDHFKRFNDRFGHQAGDRVLELVASALKSGSRPSDLVGRYGGEEFLVLLAGADTAEAVGCAERLRAEIEELGRLLARRFTGHALTVSIGVATTIPGEEEPANLVERADRALYMAKAAGRNRVVCAQAGGSAAALMAG
ncbi:MAG: HDOD domain-containing protein [Thermodesulfobacteriota bacterium]